MKNTRDDGKTTLEEKPLTWAKCGNEEEKWRDRIYLERSDQGGREHCVII